VVLLDLTMPGMDGRAALAELRRVRPDLPVVLMTGYSEHDLTDMTFGPTLHFLQKPFRPADLTACVRRLVAR
jgi:two-component system cell cycle sensor histidine kinase/response regulator CckA